MSSTSDISALLASLTNSCAKAVYRALITLRTKALKQNPKEEVKIFREKGGLKYLMPLIAKPNGRIADVALSILGNCCLENECRQEVKRLNGVNSLVTILRCLDSDSIQNRVCRTLANLAADPQIAIMIHDEGAIPLIVQFLQSTKDSCSQQSAVRALRILARTVTQRDNIVEHDGIQAISSLLSSDDDSLLVVVLRALAHLTRQCTPQCAQQIQAGEGMQAMVALSNRDSDELQQGSISILTNLVHQPGFRPAMGNAGAVSVFIRHVEQLMSENGKKLSDSLTALCLSCREAVNRVRVREGGGLKTLTSLLKNKTYLSYHEEVVSALLNFLFDETSLEVLMELDLGMILVDKLAYYVEEQRKEKGIENGAHEIEDPNKYLISPLPSCSHSYHNSATDSTKLYVDCMAVQTASLKRKAPEDADSRSPNSYSEAKIRRTYRINSPSYQQVQSAIMITPNLMDSQWMAADDLGQRSPTNTVFSPVQSPPDLNTLWRQNQPLASSSSASSWQSSPGGLSPDWCSGDERGPAARRSSEDDWCTPARASSQCSSPLTVSPMDSPQPQYACYSPVCEDYSEPEDSSSHHMDESEQHCDSRDHDVDTPSTSNSAVPSVERDDDDSVDMDLEDNSSKNNPNRNVDNSALMSSFWDNMDPGPPYVSHVLMILSRISQMEKPNASLLSPTCIDSLIAIMTTNQLSRAARILYRLVRNPLCLESLINLRFPQIVHAKLMIPRHPFDSCQVCSNLHALGKSLSMTMCLQAESPFGVGIFLHMLMTGNEMDKASSALIIPYVVRLKTLRQKSGIAQKMLDVIFSILESPESPDFPAAINSLLKMCESIKTNFVIQMPFERISQGVCVFNDESKGAKDVTFVLDDGETMSANRTVLIQSSPVFCAMFTGGFIEATQDSVRFRETTKPKLEFVIHYLYECSGVGTGHCDVLHDRDVYFLLEVAVLADRLLLCKLQTHLRDQIIKMIHPNNAADVYIFAENHNCNQIASSVLNYILGLKFELDECVEFLTDVLNTELNSKLLRDVKETVTEHFIS